MKDHDSATTNVPKRARSTSARMAATAIDCRPFRAAAYAALPIPNVPISPIAVFTATADFCRIIGRTGLLMEGLGPLAALR
jgi:hypothetical protein